MRVPSSACPDHSLFGGRRSYGKKRQEEDTRRRRRKRGREDLFQCLCAVNMKGLEPARWSSHLNIAQGIIFGTIIFAVTSIVCQTNSEWRPRRNAKMYRPGLMTTISTPGNEGRHVRYTVDDRRQFIFQVKSCHGALLSFATLVNDVEEYAVEVGLGSDNNQKSFIRLVVGSSSIFETSTPNLLHCDDMRAFWVSWDHEYFKVGRGLMVDQQTFMNLQDPNRQTFNAVVLSSSWGSSAVWQVYENSGVFLIVDTPDEHKYERVWKEVTDRQFWTFMVRAGGDVHVILTEQLGVTNANIYEFVVGGWYNNRSVIRTEVLGGGDSIKASVDIKNVVSASERREFWISWWKGQLELGQGGIYAKSRLLVWLDPAPRNIRYLSITTGFGNTGRWWLRDDRECTTYLFTEPTTSFEPEVRYNTAWISTPREEFITIFVKACKDAFILLSDSLYINPELAIEIVIGSEENSKVVFRHLIDEGNLAEVDSTFLLSCTEQRPFWISWHNGTVRLGAGPVYPHNLLLEKQLFDATQADGFRVGALGLATSTASGEWRVRESAGERIHINTPSTINDFVFNWRTIYQQDYFVFQVKACSDCHVALSPTLGVDYIETYLDLIIGGWQNTQTQIHKVVGPNGEREDFSAAVSTPQLLNCSRHIDLWVSWSAMKMRIGRGMLPSYHVLLDHTLTEPFIVKAVSMASGFGYEANFVVDEDIGDYFVFYTGSHESIRWVELATYITWYPLKIRSCGEVNVYVCPDMTIDGCYTLVLGAENNTISRLYDGDSLLVETATTDLFACYDNRHFWIRWNGNGRLEIGFGTVPGFETFLTYTEINRNILAIGFESQSDDTFTRFVVYHNTMVRMNFYTPDFFSYEQVWETVDHRRGVTFAVTACSDVHVVLSNAVRNFSAGVYDVVIGGWTNTKSVIRLTSENRHYVEVDTPNILHCTEVRNFWLTWQYGAIEIGKGEIIGQERFMDYQPLELYDVRSLGYSTGYGYDGTWTILGTGAIPTEAPVTQAPEPTKETVAETSSGLSQDAVAGIVIGVIGGLLLIVLIAMYIYDRRTDVPHAPPPSTSTTTTTTAAEAGGGHRGGGGGGGQTTPTATDGSATVADVQEMAPAASSTSSEA